MADGAQPNSPEGSVHHSTIRGRLTRLFALLFLMCGLALLVVSYVLVRQSLIYREDKTGLEQTETGRLLIASYDGVYTAEQIEVLYRTRLPDPPKDLGAPKTVDAVINSIQRDIRNDALHQLLVGSIAALLAMAIISAGVGWVASGRALKPVGQITARARRLSQDNLDERISVEGPEDELKELGDTLDGMLGRLEEAFASQRRFSANVSHELRTPLSIIRAEADLVLSEPDAGEREHRLAESCRDAADRAEALLNSLLALARSESTMGDRSLVDLNDLAGEVVSERVGAADSAHVRVELDLDASTTSIQGDPWLLGRLVANLVDNAIKHNVPGGWVAVKVERRNGSGIVRVSNTGDVLSSDQVTDLMQPFHRVAPERRPGYGLGMTIVQSVAKAHSGSISVKARREGGLYVEVDFPLHQTTPARLN